MKKTLLLLFALVAMGLTNVWAYDFSAVAPSGQTLYYNISGGNAVVTYQNSSGTRYSNLTGALVIPASVTYNGTTYSVTSIGGLAFYGCGGLRSVTIPNSVTSIESQVFFNCSGLTSVTIGNSVTSIGLWAFYGCYGLTSVEYTGNIAGWCSIDFANNANPNCYAHNLTIGGSPVAGALVIPSGVSAIKNNAFDGCSGLTSVTIPNSVTSIGNCAFQDCYGLTSVTIPNSVTSIGGSAFYGCSGLTSVTIPNSVTTIGDGAFFGVRYISYCGSATGSPWGATRVDCFYEEGDFLFEDATKATILAYIGTGTSVTIPNSVTTIGNYAFEYCSGLTSVTIGNSVTSIGNYAFRYCSGLTSVTIPNSVTSIGNSAFYNCSGLTSVTIGNSVTSIGNYAFSNCSGLTSVNYLGTVAQWCNIDFGSADANPTYYTHGLSISGTPLVGSLVIPEGVEVIKNSAFEYCSGLTSVTIPNSVTSIGEAAFDGCSGLTSVTMEGATPPTLGSNVFAGNASNRKIHVPCGAYENYYNANNGWSDYRNDLSDPIVDIDVVLATEAERGSVVIIPLRGQEVRCDSTVVVCATANYGYHFDHWSTGSTQAQDTIAVSGDTVITAYFAKNQYEITLVSGNTDLGQVNGGGTFDYLDTITLTATGLNHHHFVRWSDGNRENPRQWVVTKDTAFTAYFAIDTHRVMVVSSDISRGMVEASGTEFVYGTPCTVTATAYSGFTFAGWSNGMTANPYTFAVMNDVELTAMFISENEQIFTITVVSDNPTMGSVSGGGMAMSGGEVAIHAVANEGYHFVRWNDNNTNADRTVTVTADVTYTAYFAANQTNGIDEVEQMPTIVVRGNSIAVGNAQNQMISIYDITGRMIVREQAVEGKAYTMPNTGVYMVKVGSHPAEKVVVIR